RRFAFRRERGARHPEGESAAAAARRRRMDDRVLSGVPRLRNRARRGRALGLAAAVLAIAARAHAQEGEGSRPTVIVTDAGGKAFAIATQEFAGSGGAGAAELRGARGAARDVS